MTSPSVAPFGLQTLDLNWLTATGSRAPSQRCVAASDQNAFAVGDPVFETGASIAGIPVVSSAFTQVGPGGTSYTPVGGMFRRGQVNPLVIVAIAPAAPGTAAASPVLAGGAKAGTTVVWVIPNGGEWLIAGNGATPAFAVVPGPGNPPPTLFASNLDSGSIFADLAYGGPSGGLSGITLDGASFRDGGDGLLQVLGLTSGMPLAPRSLYRVRIRSFA